MIDTASSWIGAELEEQRARLDEKFEALAAIEAALMRYAELAGQDAVCRAPLAARTGDVAPRRPDRASWSVRRQCGGHGRAGSNGGRGRHPPRRPGCPAIVPGGVQDARGRVEAEVAPAAAPARVKAERGHVGSQLADKEPIFDESRTRQARAHDRAADQRFVAAVAPSLSPEARQRAEAVRVSEGDPMAPLPGPG